MPKTTDATLLATLQRQDVRCVELYVFDLATGIARYSSDGVPHTYGGDVYLPAAIERGAIEQGSKTEIATLDLEVHLAGWPLLAVNGDLYGRPVTVKQAWLPAWGDTPSMLSTVFAGIVDEVKPEADGVAVALKSYLALGDGDCPPRIAGPSCPWVFGGAECGVALATWQSARTTAAGSTPSVIELTAAPGSNAIPGSTIDFVDGSSRMISAVGASSVTLAVPLSVAPGSGEQVTITKGCPRTRAGCTGFSNLARFGGFASVPSK